MSTIYDFDKDIRIHDAERIYDVQSMLKALGYMPRLGFFEAWESFKLTHFGLKCTKADIVLKHMDFVCQAERVGKYEVRYPDD